MDPSQEPTLNEEDREDVGTQPLDLDTDELILEVRLGLFLLMVTHRWRRAVEACLPYKPTPDRLLTTLRL